MPLHILLIATSISPWTLVGNVWQRRFISDEENVFILIGPKVETDD